MQKYIHIKGSTLMCKHAKQCSFFSTLPTIIFSFILLSSCGGGGRDEKVTLVSSASSVSSSSTIATNHSTASSSTKNTAVVNGTLYKIDEALMLDDKKFVSLLNKVRGSVGKFRSGSKVVWSRKNDFGLGLYLSANHVFGPSWPSLDEGFVSLPFGVFASSYLPLESGSLDITLGMVSDFGLYHPMIPPEATKTTIMPANDFYIGVIDSQKAIPDNTPYGFSPMYPASISYSTPIQMYDPEHRTISVKTWAVAVSGESVIAVGFPQDSMAYPYGAVSTGKIYSDAEANDIIYQLAQAGDEEGAIAYDPSVEFLTSVKGVVGMSGGGVFNAEGQLLGIMVRGTSLRDGSIERVVRVEYIKKTFDTFFNKSSAIDQAFLKQFLGEEVN